MLRTRFVARLYGLALLFVLAVLIVLGLRIGLFGEQARLYTHGLLGPALSLYAENKDLIDKSIVAILTVGTAITGALGLLKSFYYADANLPQRLQEMIDQAADRHVHERAQLLQYVGGKYDARDFLTPGIFANPVAEVLRSVGLEGIHTKARSIATDVQRLGKEIQSLTLARTHAENVKVTGHLIRGVHFSKLARELDEDPPKIKKALNDALAEYEAALALRAEDVVALEGAIDQCEALGAREKMSGYLEALIQSPTATALQSANPAMGATQCKGLTKSPYRHWMRPLVDLPTGAVDAVSHSRFVAWIRAKLLLR